MARKSFFVHLAESSFQLRVEMWGKKHGSAILNISAEVYEIYDESCCSNFLAAETLQRNPSHTYSNTPTSPYTCPASIFRDCGLAAHATAGLESFFVHLAESSFQLR